MSNQNIKLKIMYNDEKRRFSCLQSYAIVYENILKTYPGLNDKNSFDLIYIDDDGDEIKVSSQTELMEAIDVQNSMCKYNYRRTPLSYRFQVHISEQVANRNTHYANPTSSERKKIDEDEDDDEDDDNDDDIDDDSNNNNSLKDEADDMKCVTCHEYYGTPERDSQCSICFLPDSQRSKYKCDRTRKLVDPVLFDETGIHNSYIGKCCICLEEDKEIINNFYCECIETPCRECNKSVDFCPICNEGKFYQIEQRHIMMLLDCNRPILRVWMDICKDVNLKIGEKMTLHQLYAKTSDIDFCIRSKYPAITQQIASHNSSIFNSIYCLSLFPRNMTIGALSYVNCYKDFENDQQTFDDCKHKRKRGDYAGFFNRSIFEN